MANLVNVFWFRRDLRWEDNRALYEASLDGLPILPLFILDQNLLSQLQPNPHPRFTFLHDILKSFPDIHFYFGSPKTVFTEIFKTYKVNAVFSNRDYEVAAIERDNSIQNLCFEHKVNFLNFKDQCIFEYRELAKDDGQAYTVFTPYKKKWLKTLHPNDLKAWPSKAAQSLLIPPKKASVLPSLNQLGFKTWSGPMPDRVIRKKILLAYHDNRDTPALDATTRLGPHLRFGTLSPRKAVRIAQKLSNTWLSELIWRDFFMQILANFPHVATGAFRPEYDNIKWRNNQNEFKAWCLGKTGYPLVDAGMRQLKQTGYMHNRVRMVTASFLVKDLLIDWRWGERYFADHLLDYELASNNGNWQWAAGTGCDAAPYFRIFNPITQQKKFDPNFDYIQQWLPEFNTPIYPAPIVDHKLARDRTLGAYKEALKKSQLR